MMLAREHVCAVLSHPSLQWTTTLTLSSATAFIKNTQESREINQYTNVKLLNHNYTVQPPSKALHFSAQSFFASSSNVLAHKTPFYTPGARGFSCAVSGFGQVLKSDPLRRSCLRPSADETKLLVAREKKPLVPRVTLLRFFSNFEKDQ